MDEDELDFMYSSIPEYSYDDEEQDDEDMDAGVDDYYRNKWNSIKQNIWDNLDDDN